MVKCVVCLLMKILRYQPIKSQICYMKAQTGKNQERAQILHCGLIDFISGCCLLFKIFSILIQATLPLTWQTSAMIDALLTIGFDN